MKRFTALLLLVILLTGCAGGHTAMNRAVTLRDKLLKGNGCSFTATVTADYGDKTYTFKMLSTVDSAGELTFEVIEPDSISGITGKITDSAGQLTFDDQVLMFEMLADGQITPVCAPWLLIHTLRSGYISACGKDGDGIHIQIDDSFRGEPLQADIWINEEDIPVRGEFLWKGKRIVSIDVVEFLIV